ncbi:MAG: isoprenylcysteine carboxylmethyltransferase family protein [Planctomycetota bacterium]
MKRFAILTYGVLVYVGFLATFLRAVAFISGIGPGTTLDAAPPARGPLDWAINLGLLSLFAVQHMVMARRGFKRRWTRIIPPAAERSTFVLATCIALNLLISGWHGHSAVIWDASAPTLRNVLTGLSLAGFGIVLVTSFLIDHFELFGLAQAWREFRDRAPAPKGFVTPSLYRFSRHPMYLGFFVAFWAAPTMTLAHLVFAAVTTAWVIFEVIVFEEPDLVHEFGAEYRDYQARVGMFLPRGDRARDLPENGGATA